MIIAPFLVSLFGFLIKKNNIAFLVIQVIGLCIEVASFFLIDYYFSFNNIFDLKTSIWIDPFITNIFIDNISIKMLQMITFVSIIVRGYSFGYMKKDHIKFICLLNFFTGCMGIIVIAGDLLTMFLGWEGVGVASYLLIGFYDYKKKAIDASFKAILTNRIGDVFFILAMFVAFKEAGTLEILKLYKLDSKTISLFLLIASMAKSAQIGLHFWLPDAMEGPTPASALIHSATMVTAGIFLIIRLNPLFKNAILTNQSMYYVGIITAFYSGLKAIVQDDIKRIIAYSTCSQLGLMMAGLGLCMYDKVSLHLIYHGVFKALLFLSVGSIIHIMNEEQNIKMYLNKGLMKKAPITFITMMIGSLSLIGLPGFIGHISKEPITKSLGFVGVMIEVITIFYITRLIFFTFFIKTQKDLDYKIHESPIKMTIWMIILSIVCFKTPHDFSHIPFIIIVIIFAILIINKFNFSYKEKRTLIPYINKLYKNLSKILAYEIFEKIVPIALSNLTIRFGKILSKNHGLIISNYVVLVLAIINIVYFCIFFL